MTGVFEWRDAIRRPPEGHELKPTDRLVALVLSFYMDKDTLEGARPGPARLAAETGLSPRTVKLSMQSLVKAGWIVQTSKGGTRKGGSEKIASTYLGAWPEGMRVPMQPPDTSAERAPVQEMHGSTSAERAPVQEMHGSTSAGDAPVPVHLTTDTRAGDAHHLEQDLVQTSCVGAAFEKITAQGDDQRNELEVKLTPLIDAHGEEVVRTIIDEMPRTRFAGDLIRYVRSKLPEDAKGRGGFDRGYVPGHVPSGRVPSRDCAAREHRGGRVCGGEREPSRRDVLGPGPHTSRVDESDGLPPPK